MNDTLTVKLNPETVTRLRRLASEEGESLEALVQRLLDGISIDLTRSDDQPEAQLSKAQLADLRRRVKNPGPLATPQRVAAVLAKFKV